MKFVYDYQDKANKRHSGTLCAPTKAAAYTILKSQGVKPIHCGEAPGFFNLVLGRGKRWIAICVLAVIVGVVGVLYFRTFRTLKTVQTSDVFRTLQDIETSTTRRQLVGDAAAIEKGMRTGWSNVFAEKGEQFLASYAIPGVMVGQLSTTTQELMRVIEMPARSRSTPCVDSFEARQIRAMVEGMKHELRQFLANGGTVFEYGQRLVARQEEEIKYYNIAQQDLEIAIESGKSAADVEALWERHNSSLRKMGIKTIPYPAGKDE